MCPPLRTWPTTQACALTGNWTDDPLIRRPVLNPLSHISQGSDCNFEFANFSFQAYQLLFVCVCVLFFYCILYYFVFWSSITWCKNIENCYILWWNDPFIFMKWPPLSLLKWFVLKSTLSDVSIATPALFRSGLSWFIFSILLFLIYFVFIFNMGCLWAA